MNWTFLKRNGSHSSDVGTSIFPDSDAVNGTPSGSLMAGERVSAVFSSSAPSHSLQRYVGLSKVV